MSGNNTANNPFSGLQGMSSTELAHQQQQWAAAMQNQQSLTSTAGIYPTWTTTATTLQPGWPPPTPSPLDPKTASDLIAQLEHDKVIVADHQLLFGQYMGKSLRDVPLEYIVQLGAALRGARISINKELRRRRCVERLTKGRE